MGLANERSIAFGIAQALKEQGAELGLTYLEAMEKRVKPLADEWGVKLCEKCDVSSDDDLRRLGQAVKAVWDNRLDILIHSVAFADRADLERDFVMTSRAGFQMAMDISVYSLVGACQALWEPLRYAKGSVVTLSYYGAERVIPNYNVMGVAKAGLEASVRYLAADGGPHGIRVNAISAGPIRTLAASGVKDFRSMLSKVEEKAPLRKNVTIDEVGDLAAFLASDKSRSITGEVIYADSGFHIMGL